MEISSILEGLYSLLQWPNIGYLILGVLVGSFFGLVPGLNGIVAVALFLPLIWELEMIAAIAILVGIVTSVQTANTFPAILFNIPGTPTAAATLLDGFPMAKKGEAARALAAAFIASGLGGILSAVLLGLSIPIIRPLVLLFSSSERFMLILMGIMLIATLDQGNRSKGMIAALMGFLISTVGLAPSVNVDRFSFDMNYFIQGIPMVPLVMGLYGLAELIDMMGKKSISESASLQKRNGAQLWQGIADAFRHWKVVIRGGTIGALIGAIPGLGGTAAAFFAYGAEARNKHQNFGQGNVVGVIAPESANNASQSGEFIPTLAFGVPGGGTTAVMLTAFMILGYQPGPSALTTQLPMTMSIIWGIALANVLAVILCFALLRPFASLTKVRSSILVPVIMLFVIFGSLSTTLTYYDLTVTLLFGLLGYVMMKNDWPRAPLLVAFVLGKLAEQYFFLSYQNYGWWFLSRPIVVVLLLVMVLTGIGLWWSANSSKRGDGL